MPQKPGGRMERHKEPGFCSRWRREARWIKLAKDSRITLMQIDAVIFDIGNVLLTFDYTLAERAILKHTGQAAPPSQEELHPLRMDHETGRSSRADFIKAAREAFAHDGPEDHFMEIWSRIFEVNAPMISWARSLYPRTPLYLLSNIGCIHHDHIFEEYDFFSSLFRDGVYSYKAGVMKPEARIFDLAKAQFKVDPARTLYIDDLAENVRSAESAGFVTHHYDPARHDLFLEHTAKLSFS
jgi:FMN phosphatase YigB (HAD superfamily)